MHKKIVLIFGLTLSFLPGANALPDDDITPTAPDQAALTSPPAEERKDPELYYKAGCQLLSQKKYQAALDMFNKVLELNPRDYAASYKKALVYQLTGYDKFAARRYLEILKYRPDMDEARINLAALHHKHKHYSGAEEQYNAVIAHNFYSFEAHYNLANVLLDQKKHEAALKEYKLCLKLQPANAQVHNNMGVIFLQKNYAEDALQEFKRAAKLSPTNKTFTSNISVAQKVLKDKAKQPITM